MVHCREPLTASKIDVKMRSIFACENRSVLTDPTAEINDDGICEDIAISSTSSVKMIAMCSVETFGSCSLDYLTLTVTFQCFETQTPQNITKHS